MNIKISETIEKRLVLLAKNGSGQTVKQLALNALRRGLRELEGKAFCRYSGYMPNEAEMAYLTTNDKAMIEKNPNFSESELSSKLQKPVNSVWHYRLLLAKNRIQKHRGTEKDSVVAVAVGLDAGVVMRLRINLGYKHPRGLRQDRNKQDAVIAKLGGLKSIKLALSEGGETIESLIREKGFLFSRERGRQVLANVGITGDRDLRKPIWYTLKLFEQGRPDRQKLAEKFSDEKRLVRELAKVGGVSALSRKYGVTYFSLKSYIGGCFPGISRKFTCSHGEMVEFKCDFCRETVFVEKYREKIRPHKLHFCNAKDCRDNFMRQNGGMRSLKLN